MNTAITANEESTRQTLRARIIQIRGDKIDTKDSNVGISFYAYSASKNDEISNKMNKIVLFMVISVMSSSAIAVPMSFLTKNYEANSDKVTGGWLQAEAPGFIYGVCLDKPISAQQSIVVMCGDGDEENNSGADTGYFDIWYLDGDKPVAHSLMIQMAGRHGNSGQAHAFLVGKNTWAVVLESGYSIEGYSQEFNSYYVRSGKDIINVATLPSASDNTGNCDPADSENSIPGCRADDLKNKIQFIESDSDFFPMKITSKGEFQGKKVEKEFRVAFDSEKKVYPIPEELQIRY
ncbi:conserved hypothetical protein [Enterobacterales bacterium 8AC]|nr:conserved hypothetical protein [Enterobacterales bacterium 8AC]